MVRNLPIFSRSNAVILSGFLLFFPILIHAQSQGGIVSCDTNCGWPDLLKEVNNFILTLVYLSAAIATVTFSYAGFTLLTAAGNVEKVKKAKEMFIKVLIGFIFVLGAWLLVETILKLLGVAGTNFSLLGS